MEMRFYTCVTDVTANSIIAREARAVWCIKGEVSHLSHLSQGDNMANEYLWIERIIYEEEEQKKKDIKKVRAGVTKGIRQAVIERDKYTCQLCGASYHVFLEVDHKIPVSKGGTSDIENLWTLCQTCNRKKSAKILQ